MLIMMTQQVAGTSASTRPWIEPSAGTATWHSGTVPAGARLLADLPTDVHRDRAVRFAAKQASPPREELR